MKPLTFLLLLVVLALIGCTAQPPPQRGGMQSTSLGGTNAPTVLTSTAPENPQTPSTTRIEKTTTREYFAPVGATSSAPIPLPQDRSGVDRLAHNQEAAGSNPAPASTLPLARETVHEQATTELGTAQKDMARELGTRLSNMRGVMWVGCALLVLGPVVGWKLGWMTNGLIAGGVGLMLIILATVLPGNEAWFGLLGLIGIPLVAYVYYRAQHDRDAETSARSPTQLPANPAG